MQIDLSMAIYFLMNKRTSSKLNAKVFGLHFTEWPTQSAKRRQTPKCYESV